MNYRWIKTYENKCKYEYTKDNMTEFFNKVRLRAASLHIIQPDAHTESFIDLTA